MLRAYLESRHRRFTSRGALERYQTHKVQNLLKKVLPHSPYTAERFAGLGVSHWQQIAPISKREMMANFDRLNTAQISCDEALKLAKKDEETRQFKTQINGVTVGLSSGTSGQLGLFLVSRVEQEEWAGRILGKALPDSLFCPKQDRVAFFLRANNPLYERTRSPRLAFHFFDLLFSLSQHLETLEQFNPSILIAPPSALRQIAHQIEIKNLRLNPHRVIAIAEPLDAIDEQYFRVIFKQPTIHQIYQATEGFLGVTCAHGTLHLNEDIVIVEREWLDETRFLPIVTDLFRHTQPILRYRLDDVLKIRSEPCPCGSHFTALSEIEGRLDDVLIAPHQQGGGRSIYADFWRRRILMSTQAAIHDYGLRQCSATELELYLKTQFSQDEAKARQDIHRGLHNLLDECGCLPMQVKDIDVWPAGGIRKRKHIERVWNDTQR
ncbi:adenylate cyclase [Nodosilinea sp. LEGE 07088]|uniref:F390 synthetase-related protein n=1 Tax=Nodosilinea sp. LEGE 07088 TaxID=2777968 RepID=UPI001882BC52|nr:F390 synthetase-related protein [Nodosilinea sp. LEGE 07088]MBE9138006.1 adenylate cyclase [Nodosilinea sp. LEGE 07088]